MRRNSIAAFGGFYIRYAFISFLRKTYKIMFAVIYRYVLQCVGQKNLDGAEPMRLVLLKLSGDFFFEYYRKYRIGDPFIYIIHAPCTGGQNIIILYIRDRLRRNTLDYIIYNIPYKLYALYTKYSTMYTSGFSFKCIFYNSRKDNFHLST